MLVLGVCGRSIDGVCFASGGQDLMRELEEKEEAIKSVQDKAESLMLEQHPARPTIEVGSHVTLLGVAVLHQQPPPPPPPPPPAPP